METGPTDNTHEIPKPVAQQIARMLDETESVIWSGKPKLKDYFHCKIREFAGGWLLLLMLFVFISCINIVACIKENNIFYISIIAFLATMLITAAVIQTAWNLMKGASLTYVLTNHRVIILQCRLNDSITFRSYVFSQKGLIEATPNPSGNWTIKLMHKHHFLVHENKHYQHKLNQMDLFAIEDIELFKTHIPTMVIKDTTHEC